MYAIRSYYFLTPYYNRREDEYGGKDIHNRARIIYETIEEVKSVITSYSIHYTKLYDLITVVSKKL